MEWPLSLRLDPGAKTALERVLEDHPIWAAWPEDEKVMGCPQAQAVARILVPEFHSELVNAKIAYLFVEKMGNRGRAVWAKASTQLHYLSEYDFVVTVNWTVWKDLDLVKRVALVDHELEHFGLDDKGGFCLLPHDLEGFHSIVRRYGLWRSSVVNFVDAATAQTELALAE